MSPPSSRFGQPSSSVATLTVSAAVLRRWCDELAKVLHYLLAVDEMPVGGRTWLDARAAAREALKRYELGQPSSESELLRSARRVLFYALRDPRQWHPETLAAFRDLQEVLERFD
jgi:hypothetical protein